MELMDIDLTAHLLFRCLLGFDTSELQRMTRATLLEVLSEDFIRTARAKGLPTLRLLLVHGLRNAGVPIATVIGIGIALLIGGVVITETVFNIPGIGRLVVDSISF